MSINTREFVRGLLSEDGFININHPIFEAEKNKTEDLTHAITNVLETVAGYSILGCFTKEEIAKNIQYLSYERFEDFLYDMNTDDVLAFTENITDEVIKGLATAILFEESDKNSKYTPIQWVYDNTNTFPENFITELVNEVAKIYSENDMDRVNSNFLSFYSTYLDDALFDEIDLILNKVIMYMQGEKRVRFDVEHISELWLYSELISNAKSFSNSVLFYEIDYTDEEILNVYWILHDRLTSEIKSLLSEDSDNDE